MTGAIVETKHGRLAIIGDENGITSIVFTHVDLRAPDKCNPKFKQWCDEISQLKFENVKYSTRSITAFTQNVWDAIKEIPSGQTVTYKDLATKIGKPNAVRAVASACAKNNLALLIPCHRVIRSDGGMGDYRWGADLKRRILESEK